MARTKKIKDVNLVTIGGTNYTVVGVVEKLTRVVTKSFLVKDIYERWTERSMVPDPYLQRMEGQWAKKQNSRLISTMLKGRSIGTIIIATGRAYLEDCTAYSVLDGLQRITTIVNFINNGFKLDKHEGSITCCMRNEDGKSSEHEYDIGGKDFKSLPKALQKVFLDYAVTVDSYENFSDDELDDIMFCVNNGKTPTAYQKMRFALGTENMRVLQPVCDSLTWEEVEKCSEKSDSTLASVIRSLMVMCNYADGSLSTQRINSFIENFDTVKSSDMDKFISTVEAFDEIKYQMTAEERKLLDGCNLPHFITNLSIYNSMSEKEKNGKTYIEFFRDFTRSEEWMKFSSYKSKTKTIPGESSETASTEKGEKSGSGGTQYSKESVHERQYIIDGYLYDFLECAMPHNGAISTVNAGDIVYDNAGEKTEECDNNAEVNSQTAGRDGFNEGDRETEEGDIRDANADDTYLHRDHANSRPSDSSCENDIKENSPTDILSFNECDDGLDEVCNTGHMHLYECVQAG